MNWRLAVIVTLVVAPLIWVLAAGFGHDPHAVPFVLENRPAPAFSLTTLDGKTVSLASLRGKPVLVNFWSSWCEPCKAEHEALQSSARTYADRVQFLGIVYEDSPQNAEQYLKARGNTFPQLLDPDTHTAIDFGVAGVPESFFIDKGGIIRRKVAGELTYPEISHTLDTLLAAKGTP
jgi:cytochrome c biogenesis protein CcmG/thiol:disulfide interchange protein DsbE